MIDAWSTTHPNANACVLVWVKLNLTILARNFGRNVKIHPGVRFDIVDVLGAYISIQYDPNNDVSTSSSIRLPVNSHSRSLFCVVDRSRLTVLQLSHQVVRKNQRWHWTHQPGSVCVSFRQPARLQRREIHFWISFNGTFTILSLPQTVPLLKLWYLYADVCMYGYGKLTTAWLVRQILPFWILILHMLKK